MKTFFPKIILPKTRPHRIRPLFYDFRLLVAVLCLLSAVLCQPSRAGGSWLVDGESVQSLEVQTTNADPNALYTDGTRTMAAALEFAPSVSSPSTGLFKADVPWDGLYDFFIMDEDNEAIHLFNGSAGFFPTSDLYIYGSTLGDNNGGGEISMGEMTLRGGSWLIDAVGPYAECIISRGYADSRYIMRTEGITVNHTIQAGDVLQIQNGIITAINP